MKSAAFKSILGATVFIFSSASFAADPQGVGHIGSAALSQSVTQAGKVFGESEMENTAITKFLKEANNSQSSLGKYIAKINIQTQDGRNNEGTISLPVKSSDLQVTTVEGEENNNWLHYASNENGYCRGTGDSAVFLITLMQVTGVHNASNYNVISFSVRVEENLSSKITKGSKDAACDDYDNLETSKTVTTYNISNFKLVQLPDFSLQ